MINHEVQTRITANPAIGAPRHIYVFIWRFKTDALEAENEDIAGEEPFNFLTEHYVYTVQVYKQLLNYYLQ